MSDAQVPSEQQVSDHLCVIEANKHLKSRNSALVIGETFNLRTGETRQTLLVETAKLDTKKRGRAIPMFATYCPMCGEKL